MKPRPIHTELVPPGRARISQAVVLGDVVYVSGMVSREPVTGRTVAGGLQEQTRQVMKNISAVLEAAGTSLDYVAKQTVYIQDMDHFEEFNQEWERWFNEDPPARLCVQVVLGPGFLVEIDTIAGLPKGSVSGEGDRP